MTSNEEEQKVDCVDETEPYDSEAIFKEYLKIGVRYVIAFIIFATIFTRNIAQMTRVTGQSMEGNFHDGEHVLINKTAYWSKEPQRFDVVIAKAMQNGKQIELIKRVIGLPGETVQIDDYGNIYINGKILEEDYGKEVILSYREDGMDNLGVAREGITLKENEYFIMGDNRNHSSDSRMIGGVPKEALIGKIVLRIKPFTTY